MASKEFDPYATRLARDIRNTLANDFVHGLLAGQRDAAAEAARRLLAADPPPSHAAWIAQRLELYRRAEGQLAGAAHLPSLELGLALWRRGLFFEAHEALEQAWQTSSGPRRRALKALVQAVGSCVHAQRGATAVAASLARKAGQGLLDHGQALDELPWLAELAARLNQGQACTLDDGWPPPKVEA